MPPIVPAAAEPALPPQEPTTCELDPAVVPDLDALIAMDITPVASLFTEKQQQLFVAPLYSSWGGPGENRPFLATANNGLFYKDKHPAVYPDGLLSLDVETPALNLRAKKNHSYFLWIAGKPPEVAIEVVSDRRGGEDTYKLKLYASIGITYYVIFDPDEWLDQGVLRAFGIYRNKYQPVDPSWFPEVGLGMKLWTGEFEGSQDTWLRWCDQMGKVIPTGEERAREERRLKDEAQQRADEERRLKDEAQQRADEERRLKDEAQQRADEERHLKDEAQQRADEAQRHADEALEQLRRLQERLRSLGIDPNTP